LACVYDGAGRGKHHEELRSSFGYFSVNKAHGYDGKKYKNLLNTEVHGKVEVHDLDFTTSHGTLCRHRVTLGAGMLYAVENDFMGIARRTRIVDHVGARSVKTPEGYRWELDLQVHCNRCEEHHQRIIDPSGQLGKQPLAEHLRPLPVNHEEFWRVYGYRNAAESGNNYIKRTLLQSGRAQSLTAERHEFDLRLVTILHNALAWAEHGSTRYIHIAGRAA
jgi:hypothetical protein